MVLGNLTDLCLTWTWSHVSKCQRVWLKIRPTFDISICTELKGIDFLIGYAVACSSSHARVQDFLSGKLQVCKILGGRVHYFPGGPLANFYGNLYNLWFQGDEGPDPLPSFGSAHASSLNFLHIPTCFHSVFNHFTRLYKVRMWPITWYLETGVRQCLKIRRFSEAQIFVLTNNLRCFGETDVRTSQKTTYAQFKIYRTNFIDEIGPRPRGYKTFSMLNSDSRALNLSCP